MQGAFEIKRVAVWDSISRKKCGIKKLKIDVAVSLAGLLNRLVTLNYNFDAISNSSFIEASKLSGGLWPKGSVTLQDI